jgi:hypothetical protein
MTGPATVTLPALHPAHLEDLRKSGLDETDAAAARIYSARPSDIPNLTGRTIPDTGVSGLVFPYHGCDGFTRVKLFPPLVELDGTVRRYLQRKGTGSRLYVPPSVAPSLPDAAHPLAIVEGEKKTLAVCKAGWPAVGIGGIWNFITGGGLIPDLKAIPLKGRIVRIIPDGETWHREDLLPAVLRLVRLLDDEGATVFIVKLPMLNGEKTGADDYIVAKGAGAFGKLVKRAVTLGDPAFRALRQKEKTEAGGAKATQPLPATLAGRRIHPALDFEGDGLAIVGIVTIGPDARETTETITSTRERFPSEAIGPALTTRPFAYPDLVNRWHPEDVTRFLDGKDSPPTFESAVAQTWDRLDTLLELGRDCETVALATWTVATYFHPAFLAFPRLDLRGEMDSGKTKALSILAAVSLNGLLRVSPTPAVLFRLAEALRPTLCLDEIEGLAGDEKREVLAILNAGYKRGGRVDRCEGDDHTVKSYSIYAPVALAGIQGLNRVTEDRAITLVLTRGKDRAKLNAEVDPTDARFAEIRDVCYRLALLRWHEVAETSRTLALPDWLVGRERELWSPLLTVATLADREAGDLNLVADLLTLAREQGEDRAGLSDEAEALVWVLTEKLAGEAEIILLPGELCEDLKTALKLKDAPSPQRVGRWMKRLGFPPAPRSAGGKRRRVTADALADLRKRYGES